MNSEYKISRQPSDPSVPPEPYPKEVLRLRPAMRAYLFHRKLCYKTAQCNFWYPTSKVRESDPVVRIVIPAVNSIGRPYWQARAMVDHPLRYRSARGGRFQSIVVVWPVISAIMDKAVIVEGPMDALAAAGLGYLSIATMGEMFSSYAETYLSQKMYPGMPVVVIPDMDCPEFGTDVVSNFSQHGRKAEIRLPIGGKDLAKMGVNARKEVLR